MVRSFSRVRLKIAPKGRAEQLNAGARIAGGEVFLFLHADVRLPREAKALIEEALQEAEVVGGAFRTRTVSDHGRSWASPFLFLADLRSRYSSFPYGDQALFVRTEVFRRIGGFPDLPLMEDLAFSRRLRREGKIRTLKAKVTVSGRRFLARPVYYTLLPQILPALYRLGVSPHRFSRLYGDPR
jgi:glycosyltransferase involved in cell wall biosynthesis